MDASAYALVHGIRSTRAALDEWNRRPWPVLRAWLVGSLGAATALLLAVWAVATIAGPSGFPQLDRPPLRIGHPLDVTNILGRNALVLVFHAMACVAGFIAGSSLPLQAREQSGIRRALHEHGGRFAILFVITATTFSLSVQALVIGNEAASVAAKLHTSVATLLIALLPHALPELAALFLPLAAWIIASRRSDWDELLAATLVTVSLAFPTLVITAAWEVYVAPHVLSGLIR
jgi:hypothetical protein